MEKKTLVMKDTCRKRFEPVITAVEQLLESEKDMLLVAIDGSCASGKTTLGYYLKERFDCSLFHMDDFFLQDKQRTEQRLAEVGGNVDYERFQKEVLDQIVKKRPVIYRPFDCSTRKIREEYAVPFQRLNVIEGSYSMHPYFGDLYDLRVFMNISEEDQIQNIRNRNGEELLGRFLTEWIPKENDYFDKFHVSEGCIQLSFHS